MKTIQNFSDEYLEYCKKLSPEQKLQFLEDFRILNGQVSKESSETSVLISLKISPALLRAFKVKAGIQGLRYQTQIKTLMQDWIKK